jgi:hypothetical protein
MTKTPHRDRDEQGSALILALVFVFAVGIIILALATFTSNSMLTTSNVRVQRTSLNDAETATVAAMQYLRNNYSGTTYNAAPAGCLPTQIPSGGGPPVGGPTGLPSSDPRKTSGSTVNLYCIASYNPFSSATRVVDFYACGPAASAATCTAGGSSMTVLHAEVTYNDYPTSGPPTCGPTFDPNATPPQISSCGTAMTVNSWDITNTDS